ncbi:MAG: regulatory protein GemA [Ramlibacter sp.]|nr:regulatory protein GemA [Ramlibacter sp.]
MAVARRAVDPSQRRNELAQIHIAVAALGWSEADYRAILQAKTGRSSAGDLDSTGRRRFLDHLRQCGWQPKPQGPRLTKQQWLIQRLWKDLGAAGALEDKSPAALNRFIKAQGGPDDIRFLGTSHASLVIEALKGWLSRVGGRK